MNSGRTVSNWSVSFWFSPTSGVVKSDQRVYMLVLLLLPSSCVYSHFRIRFGSVANANNSSTQLIFQNARRTEMCSAFPISNNLHAHFVIRKLFSNLVRYVRASTCEELMLSNVHNREVSERKRICIQSTWIDLFLFYCVWLTWAHFVVVLPLFKYFEWMRSMKYSSSSELSQTVWAIWRLALFFRQ